MIEYFNENDELHREDGPAVEWADGGREWWVNGERHREDGPAVEWPDGTREWWVNGKHITEEEFAKLMTKSKELDSKTARQKLNSQYLRAVTEVLKQACQATIDEMVATENRFAYADLSELHASIIRAQICAEKVTRWVESLEERKLNAVAREESR